MSKVKQQVMASVLVVYAMRKALSVYALKAYALAVALSAIFFTVSVPHILTNMMHAGLLNTGSFLISAFVATSLTVQTMSVAVFIFAVLLVRDTFVSREQSPA
jgi:hypothetical protein